MKSPPNQFGLPVPYQIADFRQLPSDLDPLKREDRWIGWQYMPKANGWTKEPRSRYGRKYGKPEFWFSFEAACVNAQECSGNAFVQTPECDWAFIDLDHCIEWENDRPVLAKWAQPIVEAAFKAGAYVEITVSKHGVRILGTTRREQSLSRNIRDGDYAVEVYARTTRFVTVSGMQRGRGSPEASVRPDWT